MGFLSRGKWTPLPWGADFDNFLFRMSETTYKHEGAELLHEIHKQVIEAHYVNMHLHAKTRTRLNILILLGVLGLALVAAKT